MASLTSALDELRQERDRARHQVDELDRAITLIQGLVGQHNGRTGKLISLGKRFVSAASRKKMAIAQKARWNKARKLSARSTASPAAVAPSSRRRLSLAARKKIAAAQRARWAKFRSKQEEQAA